MKSDIIRKIKALRARAADAASSENEAAKAASVADKLLREHNIDLSELDVRAEGVEKGVWGAGKRLRGAECSAAINIAKATDTEAWVQNGGEIVYLGNPADVEVALYYTDLVSNAADACLRQYRKTADYSRQIGYWSARKVHNDFRKGLCGRVGQRILEQVQLADVVATGSDLVVVKNALINQWLADAGMKFRQHKSRSRVGAAHSHGRAAGENVAIGRGIGVQRSGVLALS